MFVTCPCGTKHKEVINRGSVRAYCALCRLIAYRKLRVKYHKKYRRGKGGEVIRAWERKYSKSPKRKKYQRDYKSRRYKEDPEFRERAKAAVKRAKQKRK